jgi:saccharopine dehydrogenase (NAD+, L-lysine forming)
MTRPITIGIRRENDRKFEARTPLLPEHVRQILTQFPQVKFLVQPSTLRAYSPSSYAAAGATIQEDLSAADLILCIKEVYPEQLINGKTYLVFAHVIKGQKGNMPVLQELLDRRITLVDYESIVDESRRRTVFFGRSAGHSGMLETLRALGNRLESLGTPSVFSQLKPIYDYPDLAAALAHLGELAKAIRQDPGATGIGDYPAVFAVAGLGNVGQGAIDIFEHLPHRVVTPSELASLPESNQPGLVLCKLGKADLLRNAAGIFDAAGYAANPLSHGSILPKMLPYLTALLNCVFYAPQFPKILPQPEFRAAWLDLPQRLQIVGDLSCDPPDGSVACSVTAGDLYNPVFDYNPANEQIFPEFGANSVTVMAIDNLCAGLPVDASAAFSTMLLPYLEGLIHANWAHPGLPEGLPPDVARAVVTHQGQLTEGFAYLEQPLRLALAPALV